MPGRFVLKKSKNGKFSFNLKAGNGQVVLTSEMYNSKAAAKNGVASVRKNCRKDSLFDRCTAKNGKTYFCLKSTNGQIIGKSQMYGSTAALEKGITSVVTNAPDGAVEDLT